MKKKIFLSTSIPYVNGEPHQGHALEFVQADALARYYREKHGRKNVYFLSGTDENALKNVLAAEKAGESVERYVEKNSKEFKDLKDVLNIDFDGFIQTTEKRHKEGARKLWKRLKKEDVYKDVYEGLYCVGCEEFKRERDLVEGKCPEHEVEPEYVKEENYFFRLSNYEDKIRNLIESDKVKIVPESRKNEALGFLREGLHDFSISRSKKRAKGWGVEIPGDNSQIMYVWVDALSNYITGLGFADNGELYGEFWEDADKRIHVVGKGILKFHALYWVGILLSAELPLPTDEYVHGYVTVEGKKIGKSLGNAIHPEEVVKKYGVDASRYYLLKEIPSYGDGDFSWKHMGEVYRADLANGLGNLVSRVEAMVEKTEGKLEVKKSRLEMSEDVCDYLEKYRFDKAVDDVWRRVRWADKYINENEVWALEGKEKVVALEKLVEKILQIGWDLKVFLPETADEIIKRFGKEEIVKGDNLFGRV